MKKEDKIIEKKAEIEAKLAQVDELKMDLQRTRADFENYRKNTENRILSAQKIGEKKAILSLLPLIDDIERAISHLPNELENNPWAQNVVKMHKNLDKNLEKIGVKKIQSNIDTVFNPEIHEAISFDEDSDGENEVISENLRSGYEKDSEVIRPAMVKVTRK